MDNSFTCILNCAGMPVETFRVQSPFVSLGILFLGALFGLMRVRKLKLALCPSLVLAALVVGLCQAGQAQDYDLTAPDTEWREVPVSGGVTLFQNVRIFDGKSPALSTPSNVLVKGNTIERISASPITVDTNTNVRVIAAEGAGADARPHRRALACVYGGHTPVAPDDRRPPIPSSVGCATG